MELGVCALQEFKERHIPPKRFKADFRLGQLLVVRVLFQQFYCFCHPCRFQNEHTVKNGIAFRQKSAVVKRG